MKVRCSNEVISEFLVLINDSLNHLLMYSILYQGHFVLWESDFFLKLTFPLRVTRGLLLSVVRYTDVLPCYDRIFRLPQK